MKICIAIPVRYQSSRLPGKPLLKINGKSIIRHTVESIQNNKYVPWSDVYVFTDDIRIKEELGEVTDNVIMVTEACNNGTERIILGLQKIDKSYDYIVNVQGDEPFLDVRHIDHIIETTLERPGMYFCSILHYNIRDEQEALSTATVKVVTDIHDNALYYSRSLIPGCKEGVFDDNITYLGMIGLYMFKGSLIKDYMKVNITPLQKQEDIEQLKILELGYKIKSLLTPYPYYGSVNTIEDYEKFKLMYETKKIE